MDNRVVLFLVLAGILLVAAFAITSFQDVAEFADTPSVYPFTTIVNGTLPEVLPVVYLGAPQPNGYNVNYKSYFPNNNTWSTSTYLNGDLRNLDGLQIYGDKVVFVGKNNANTTWFKIVYTNGTTFKDWVQLYP